MNNFTFLPIRLVESINKMKLQKDMSAWWIETKNWITIKYIKTDLQGNKISHKIYSLSARSRAIKKNNGYELSLNTVS